MERFEKSEENAKRARLAALKNCRLLGRAWESEFKILVTTYNYGIPFRRVKNYYPTNLLLPVIDARRQANMFKELVDVLFNEKGKWDEGRIERSIKLIEGGARIAVSPADVWEEEMLRNPTTDSMRNMKIWENLEGHCIADIAPRRWPRGIYERHEKVRSWRKKITQKGYRDGWQYYTGVAFQNLDQMNDDGVLIGPYGQLVPKGAPPRVARLKLKEARRRLAEWRRANSRAAADGGRRDEAAQERLVRKPFNGVIQEIGWEMPGGDLMIMLLKKKIPIEIVRTLLDYGMYTFKVACFNDHARARQDAERALIASGNIASFKIVAGDGNNGLRNAAYINYFAPGWSINNKLGPIHFIIKQYAQQYVNHELDSQWLFSTIKDLKYYQDFLKLLFIRDFRIIGEKGATNDENNDPILPGKDEYVPAVIDSLEYQNMYKQYFPRLTAIAQDTIGEYNAMEEQRTKAAAATKIQSHIRGRRVRRPPPPADNMEIEQGSSASWTAGGRRRTKRRRKRTRRRKKTYKKNRKRRRRVRKKRSKRRKIYRT